MYTYKRRLRWGASLIVVLLLNLMLTQTSVTQANAATCTSGYALWASGQTQDNGLFIYGSNSTINGGMRSNARIQLSGSNNRTVGAVEYVSSFADGGDSNRYVQPAQVAVSPPPLSYTITDYRPGGVAAAAAERAGQYTVVTGDLDVSDGSILNGLYYVTGNAKLSAQALRGTFTLVAEGTIDASGSSQRIRPYADGLLLFANKRAQGASVIKIAGSNSDLRGIIYAPGGVIELSGSATTIAGIVIGEALKLSGSSLSISFAGEYCSNQPTSPDDVLDGYVPNELVVKLFNAADLVAVAQANGLDSVPLDQFGTRPIFLLRITDGTDPLVKAEQLRSGNGSGGDARVQYAEPNYLAQVPEWRNGRGSWVVGEDVGGYLQQWAPTTIRLAEAHARSRGAGVTVAVLDTGVDLDHPALADRLVAGFDFVDFDGDPREVGVPGTNEGFGHGTHVAGLVALVAPDAKIMPVRVLDADGVGNIWVLSEGLLFAAERGPDGQAISGDEAQVINLSLGTLRRTQLLEDLIAELTCADDDDDNGNTRCATSGGVMVAAAAGNGGNTIAQYPAAEDVAGSLAVGASTRNDTRANFSTYGSWVQFAAPGEVVVSTVPGGGYATWSGTSMAAPQAAGVAALVRSVEPKLNATDVTARLINSARTICGPIPLRLDAAAALGAATQPAADCSSSSSTFLPLLAYK